MGVQSVNPRSRREVLRRFYTDEQVGRSISLLRESGIPFLTDTLLGIPGETEKDVVKMVEFYLDHPGGYVNSYWLIPFARHDIVEIAREKGHPAGDLIRACEEVPFSGNNIVRPDIYPRRLEKFQNLLRMVNYLPPVITRVIVRYRLYRSLPAFDFSLFFRRLLMFKSRRKDAFPHPRDGFELVGLRRREEYLSRILRLVRFWLSLKWLRKKSEDAKHP